MKSILEFARRTLQIALVAALFTTGALAAEGLRWRADKQILDADLTNAPLIPTFEQLAAQTGWHIYLEPTPGKTFSTKFSGLARGEAMHALIGDMNYMFVPDTDGTTKLYVFRTSRTAATYEVKAKLRVESAAPTVRKVPNELVVMLKPGANIDDIAKKLGAKVKGRIGDLNAYLLEFENEAALESARKELASNEGVESTDYNYYVDAQPPSQKIDNAPLGPPQVGLNPPPADGRIIIGLVDTAVQAQNIPPELQKFLLEQISVAGDAGIADGLKHGTSMFETILRALEAATGGKTSAMIRPVDVFGANANATTFAIADGVIRAVNGVPGIGSDGKPTAAQGANIINLSLGSDTGSPFLQNVIAQVIQRGIVVFGAAGNTPVTTPFYPAAYPGVIAVTAANQPGQLASYANRWPNNSMMAPGNSIVYFNNQAYLVSGTSAASAFAAGLTAGTADSRGISVGTAATSVQTSMPFTSPK